MLKDLSEILQAAAHQALQLRESLELELKPDGSLVTNVDREIETLLRDWLTQLKPAAIWGEEFGLEGDPEGDVWMIDPIDGTSNFVYGQPLWGITCGLRQNGRITLGGVILPELEEVYVAAAGKGATVNGDSIDPLDTDPLEPFELVGHCSLKTYEDTQHVLPGKLRHHGALVVEAMFLATGALRAMTLGQTRLYDAAGSIVILRELGAEFRTLEGELIHPEDTPIPEKMPPMVIAAPGVAHWEEIE